MMTDAEYLVKMQNLCLKFIPKEYHALIDETVNAQNKFVGELEDRNLKMIRNIIDGKDFFVVSGGVDYKITAIKEKIKPEQFRIVV